MKTTSVARRKSKPEDEYWLDKSRPALTCTEKPPYGDACKEPGCPIHDALPDDTE